MIVVERVFAERRHVRSTYRSVAAVRGFIALFVVLVHGSGYAQVTKDPWATQRGQVKRGTFKVVVELKEAPTVPEEGTAFVVHVTGDEDNPTVYLATAAHVILGGEAVDSTRLDDVVTKVTVRRGKGIRDVPVDPNHVMIPERWESTDRDFAILVIDHFGEKIEPIGLSRRVPRVAENFEVFGVPRKGQDAQLIPCQVSGALGSRPRRMLPAARCSTDHGMSGGPAYGLAGVFGIFHGADADAGELRLFSMAALVCPYASQFIVDWPDCLGARMDTSSGGPFQSPPPSLPVGVAVLRTTTTSQKWTATDPLVQSTRSQDHNQRTSILGVHIEPTRHPHKIHVEADAGRRLSNPRLTCVSGACPWTQKVYERVIDGRVVEGEFDAWGSPTTWTLTADQERLDVVREQKEERFELRDGRYIGFVVRDGQEATVQVTLTNGRTRNLNLGESFEEGPLVFSHRLSDGATTTYTYIVSVGGFVN